MYGSGQQTGISTPRSAANLRPLILSHGSLEYTLLIPTALHFNAQQLRDTFKTTLPEPTDELAQDDEPSSVPELVARYLGFVAKEVEEGEDPDSFEEVLKLVLTEFERAFLRGNEVHALAASLPGITEKKLLTVRSYYAARAAVERPSSTTSRRFSARPQTRTPSYTLFSVDKATLRSTLMNSAKSTTPTPRL